MRAAHPHPDGRTAPRLLLVRRPGCDADVVLAALALASAVSERHLGDPGHLLWRAHYEDYRAWWAGARPVQTLEGDGPAYLTLAERALLPAAAHGGALLVGPAPPDRLEPVLRALLGP